MKYFICTLLISFFANSSELRLDRDLAIKFGFRPHSKKTYFSSYSEIPKSSVPWPVSFLDSRHTIGNSMPEYQNYGTEAYYHEGSDLRVAEGAPVVAPVSGTLRGDFYTYVTNPLTGEDKKYTKPYDEGGDSLYFEITIETPDHYMFEFHHVDPGNLPKEILSLVRAGGGNIQSGKTIGYAASWPNSRYSERYDHIHYNIISPNGVYLNSEYLSQAMQDAVAPKIRNVIAVYKSKTAVVRDAKLESLPSELLVLASDMKGDNIYPLPPVFIEAAWGVNEKVNWDFSKTLLDRSGKFPDIREVFATNIKTWDGQKFTTRGDYYSTDFLFRLKLPSTAVSPITITVRDSSDNETKLELKASN